MAAGAVIFDMDGVLVLSAKAHWHAWRTVAAEHGIDFDRARFLACNGRTNADICALLFGAAADPDLVAAVEQRKESAWRRAIAGRVPLAPGCRELLDELARRGLPLALGSSAPAANVDLVLDGGGIRASFAAVVHAGMIARGKPAPDVFLRAAELLAVAPADCVVVEDAPTGLLAAQAAGMRAIGVATTHDEAELCAAGARHVVPGLADLPLGWLVPGGAA